MQTTPEPEREWERNEEERRASSESDTASRVDKTYQSHHQFSGNRLRLHQRHQRHQRHQLLQTSAFFDLRKVESTFGQYSRSAQLSIRILFVKRFDEYSLSIESIVKLLTRTDEGRKGGGKGGERSHTACRLQTYQTWTVAEVPKPC